MAKKTTAHNDYWGKRSADIMRHVDRTDVDMFADLQKIYAEGSAEMQKELFAFVSKYAEDGSMSYQEALQRLRGVDLSDYQANAEKYRKQAENDPELLKRLDEQYASSKVTRMDTLNLEMTYKLGVMQGVIDKSIGNYFKSVAGYAYKKAMGGNSGALNAPALEELVRTPFDGKNYSERVWGNTDNLANDLRDVLKRGFIRGDDVRSMAGELAKKYNVARSRAQTLVRTDGTAIVNRSAIRRYQDADLEYYRISVQMDNRTSETCKRIYAEDKRYRMDEFEPGVTAPPFHFNCRSAVIPDDEELLGEKDFGDLKKDLMSLWDGISSGKLGYKEIKDRLSDRYSLGDLPDSASILGMPRTVSVTSHDLARTLAKHRSEFPFSQMLLIKNLIEAPDYIADNTQHHNNSILLYVKVPERQKYLMEGALIPKSDGSYIIHYHKIKKQKLNKLRREHKILYEKEDL